MIRSTFIFLDGISHTTEKTIWHNGIYDWSKFLLSKEVPGISKKRKSYFDMKINNAKKHLMNEDSSYFSKILPKKHHWRLFPEFCDKCIYLDIEISGVDDGYITCISLFDGYNTMTFVKGFNLDLKHIKKTLSNYKMIITFNGNVFDIPFLKKKQKDLIPDIPCWDLRHSCAQLGLKGGLKQIEKLLAIKRPNKIVQDLHGGDPIKLWRTYLATGDRYYLELLVEYNQEDVINLKTIADKVFPLLIQHSRSE